MANPSWKIRAKDADLRVRNFINGQYVEVNPGECPTIKLSPRDGRQLYQMGSGSRNDVEQAVGYARKAFDDGRWRGLPVQQRKAVLQKLADLIDANKDELALNECLDVGKPITMALNDDLPTASGLLRSFAEKADQLLSPSGVDGGAVSYQLRKPVGVVGGIVGWNYPLALAVIKAGPALATGNSLVLKPSEFSSLSTSKLAALAIEAGVPAGVFNVVHGTGAIVGNALATHPDVNLLSFTGSSTTGKQMMVAAGQSNMKRLLLECGGKSPFIIFDDCPADLDMMASLVAQIAFRNQGQWCLAGSRLLLQEGIKDKLLPKIVEQTLLLKPQDPLDPTATFGAVINEAHMNKILDFIDSGKREGAELILGGQRVHINVDNTDSEGYFIEPTIFDCVKADYQIAQEEIFGPVLAIITFKDEEEAIRLANSTRYGLAAYVATQNFARIQHLGQCLNVGSVTVVGSSAPSDGAVEIAAEAHRESGFGYETGLAGLASYTISTTMHLFT